MGFKPAVMNQPAKAIMRFGRFRFTDFHQRRKR
jgi:hypothetical protein